MVGLEPRRNRGGQIGGVADDLLDRASGLSATTSSGFTWKLGMFTRRPFTWKWPWRMSCGPAPEAAKPRR